MGGQGRVGSVGWGRGVHTEYLPSITLIPFDNLISKKKNSLFMSQRVSNQCWLAHPRLGRRAGSPGHQGGGHWQRRLWIVFLRRQCGGF